MGVTGAQLQNIIDLYLPPEQQSRIGRTQQQTRSFNGQSQRLDVRAYLKKNGIECIGEKQHGSSVLYLLAHCVFDKSHSGGEAAIGQNADGKLFYQCFHDSCKNRTWKEARQIISSDAPLFEGGSKPFGQRAQTEDNKEEDKPDSPLPLVKKGEESEPFPFKALGSTMAAACEAIKAGVQAPDAIIAQSIMGAANLAVQGHRDIIIDGRVFPVSLFLFSIAATGERKSAVDSIALARHREIEKNNISKLASKQGLYEINQSAYEHERNVLIKHKKMNLEEKQAGLEKLKLQEPVKPLDQTILVTDFTFEGLFKLYQVGVPGKGLFADEGGQVTGGHGMKRENILATAAGLSKFWDGTKVDRIRVQDGFSHLYGRRLAVHLMMQEGVGIDFYTNGVLVDQGLISRFLAAWPTSTVGSRVYNPVNVQASEPMAAFYQKVTGAVGKKLQYAEDSNDQELTPPLLPLSPEAKRMWEELYNGIESESGPKKQLAPIGGLANKAAEHGARIAGTIQLFEDPTSTDIKAEAMGCGIAAVEWYLNEALRITGSFVPDRYLLKAREVLRWIHDNKFEIVVLPDIYQYSPARSAHQARKVVEVLIAHNHLLGPFRPPQNEPPRDPVKTKSGKTSREWWVVHPDSKDNFCHD